MRSSDFLFRKYKQDSAFCVGGVLQLVKTGPPVTKNFPLLRLFLTDAMMARKFYTPYDVNCTNFDHMQNVSHFDLFLSDAMMARKFYTPYDVILTMCRMSHILT